MKLLGLPTNGPEARRADRPRRFPARSCEHSPWNRQCLWSGNRRPPAGSKTRFHRLHAHR